MKKKYHKKHNFNLDIHRKIKCISCHKLKDYTEMYNSLVHFERNSYWCLLVCEKCHQKELEEDEVKGNERKRT